MTAVIYNLAEYRAKKLRAFDDTRLELIEAKVDLRKLAWDIIHGQEAEAQARPIQWLD